MNKDYDDQLGVLWRNQAPGMIRISPEQLRAKADQFEQQVRFRYLRDQTSFAIVAIALAYGVIALDGALVRLGCVLLLLWALYCMYGLRRFGSALSRGAEEQSESCAAHHYRQLARQRDIALSRPLGIGLAAPGFLLIAIGGSIGPRDLPWEITIGLVGVFTFICLAVTIHGKMIASQWQVELDELKAMRDQNQ